MADSFDSSLPEEPVTGADVEMAEDQQQQPQADLPFAEGGPDDDGDANNNDVDDGKPAPPRITFAQYLSTPIVTLVIGSGGQETLLSAHQGLLVQSSYFAEACGEFADDGSVSFSLPGVPHLPFLGGGLFEREGSFG